ncbi:class I mannose-6-phosphate isomerase [Streptomyces sp. TS71-3]|uniref:class I mannose-6-phosphate isomerase n=1 Tax=Streptomyces sp. TS71-3 TaxID=2733862 RepID=UPI001B007534|nr:class I mannose-6-phosphate isomerase [Streptomyces sp. TS71-3]GHJ39401.1 mannose-6-phosphate isomerase [Streptomyces sp. TS71-3]
MSSPTSSSPDPAVCDGRSPLLLPANRPARRPYRGGSGIARFRGISLPDDRRPEDFLASTTEVFAGGGVGLTVLPDGRTLRSAVSEDPAAWLGPEHVRRFGADTRLLVKLLSTDERLFAHYHPDAAFAQRHLGRDTGKTEAWIILDTAGGDGYAYIGFTEGVTESEVAGWVAGQDVERILGAMRRVPLRRGDTLFVPAGTPHAIGPGVTLVELQEPTDLSLLLEYGSFGLSQDDAFLGLSPETALEGLDRTAVDDAALARLLNAAEPFPGPDEPLLSRSAEPYFRAFRRRVDGTGQVAPGFGVLVVEEGQGWLESRGQRLPLAAGTCALLPYGAGEVTLGGTLSAIHCAPPAPERAG